MSRFHVASIDFAKGKGKLLKSALAELGHERSLSSCRDALACLYGYRDWSELTVVTRSKVHTKSSPTDFTFDSRILATQLDLDESTATTVLGTVRPSEARRPEAADQDAFSAARELLELSRFVGYAVDRHAQEGRTRFLVYPEGTLVREGFTTITGEQVLSDMLASASRFGDRLPDDVASLGNDRIVDEIWKSMIRRMRYDSMDRYGQPFTPERFIEATTLSGEIPLHGTYRRSVLSDDVVFDIERTSTGIEMRLQDGPPILATLGIEITDGLVDALAGGGVLIVIGNRRPLTELARRRRDEKKGSGSEERSRYPSVLFDPDDTTLHKAMTDLSHRRSRVISLPENSERAVVRRLYSLLGRKFRIGDRWLRIAHVEHRLPLEEKDPCTVTDVTSWQQRRKPYVPPKPLAEPDLETMGLTGEAIRLIRKTATEEGSILVSGPIAGPILASIASLRVRHAPDLAKKTIDTGSIDETFRGFIGTNSLSPSQVEWLRMQIETDIFAFAGQDPFWYEPVAVKLMTGWARLPDIEFDALENTRVSFVDCKSFGRPCPRCSLPYEKSWVFGDELKELDRRIDRATLRTARFRSPFGCEHCRESGYRDTSVVTGIVTPSFEDHQAVRKWERERRKACLFERDTPLDKTWKRKRDFEYEPNEDAMAHIANGAMDPVDWIRSTGFAMNDDEAGPERRGPLFDTASELDA